uniref:Uncharacterized protein LOC111119003 n=1 Tax=Crassostrea virginica TaxID=6565 RepID=A0A8B8CJ45_CRAVI|nr:uncharacterized protein LOC111119003 [Crassostrea virginica]
MERDRGGAVGTPTLFLRTLAEYRIPIVSNAFHVSLQKSNNFWVSDGVDSNLPQKCVLKKNYLVQTNPEGAVLNQIQTSGGEGYHTVTDEENLIYADRVMKVINKITEDKIIKNFTKTGDWEPLSIHSSRINGDILVGMIREGEAKVTRYNRTGREIQNIQKDNKGETLYVHPHYITENINGDICTSDIGKHAVVVVDGLGNYRFSYEGNERNISPYGICTDTNGRILVCDYKEAVHRLDQDGNFREKILPKDDIFFPCTICLDDENNLFMGNAITSIVKKYEYLQ